MFQKFFTYQDTLQKNQNKPDWGLAALIVICVSFAYTFYSSSISSDNMNYAIEELHQYNKGWFLNNIGIEGVEVSPRYFANQIVSLIMNVLDCSWASAGMLIIQANYVLYGLAAAIAANRISKEYRFVFGILIVFCIFSDSLGNMAFGLSGAQDVFLGTGIPFALIGITFSIGENKKWSLAWLMLSFAALMHIHEGMWGGFTVGFIWLITTIINKKIEWRTLITLPVFVATILLVTLPAIAGSEAVDSKLFFDIYVNIRTPHHLLPTYWGTEQILLSLSIICLPALFILVSRIAKKLESLSNTDFAVSIGMIVLWLLILAVEYYATLINPNNTIITMYITKCFKYAVFVTMIMLLKLSASWMNKKLYLEAVILVAIIVSGYLYIGISIILVLMLLLFLIFNADEKILNVDKLQCTKLPSIFMSLIILILLLLVTDIDSPKLLLLIYPVVFVMQYLSPYIKAHRIFVIGICIALSFIFFVSIRGKIININSYGITYVSGEESLKNTMGIELYNISKEFGNLTENDEVFLADPYNETSGWVQIVSKRSCYALYKCTPSAQTNVIEWYDRIKSVENMNAMSGEELKELLQRINVKYVLVYPEQYHIMENYKGLDLILKNNAAAIYKVNS